MKYTHLSVQATPQARWMHPTCLNQRWLVERYNASGATTLDEYRQYIEKDGALERRFQKILVDPTTVDETITILQTLKRSMKIIIL